ncbi:MAG: uracil-DNA glycosylase family protein [Planctomycetota bacterium]|nr:uracil-DNA glycosylase family protein [Planctomycetota bacterium]
MTLVRAARKIRRQVDDLTFADPVAYVYNPLDYAWKPHSKFLQTYGEGHKEFLLLGMNPGPFGMAQTGVPFGEIAAVQNFLGIDEKVGKPSPEHPKRPISGFACSRSEVSGRRLWGWCETRFGTAERFFQRFYVHNFCPLVFMDQGGRNLTPDKLPANERGPLFQACDESLRRVVELQRPRMVIGIGAFAEKRAQSALADFDVEYGRIPHPSPASPLANRGWDAAADQAFADLGLPGRAGW